MKTNSEHNGDATHFKPPKRKAPQSRISDLLPSNIIDEIEFDQPTPPKPSLSFNNLEKLKDLQTKQNHNAHNALCYQNLEQSGFNNNNKDLRQQQQQQQQQQQFQRKPPSRKSFNSSQNLMYSSLSKSNVMYPQTQSALPQQQFQFFPRAGDNSAFNAQMMNAQNSYQDFLFHNNNNNTHNNNNNIIQSIPQQSSFNRTFVKPRNTNSDNYVISSLLSPDNNYSNNNMNSPLPMYQPQLAPSANHPYLTQFPMQHQHQLQPNQIHISSAPTPPPPLTEIQIDAILSQFQAQLDPPQLQGHQPQSKPQYIQISALIEKTNPSLFLKLIRTNKGSRYLQKSLSLNPPSQTEIEIILNIISTSLEIIMCDYYGNYFLQKFLPYLSFKHRMFLYKHIKPNFLLISHDTCGNHTLQSLILLQNSKEEEQIIRECIEADLESLCFAANGSHVVQKVIKTVKETDREYINNFVISNLIDLCLNAYGICVVKEFIDCTENEFYKRSIISIFELEVYKLTFDQFGNFGIQEAIKVFGGALCKKIIHKIVEHIVEFSLSKFSSNAVDFVVDYLSTNNKKKFMDVLRKIFFEDENLKEMLKSKFATYVIENCLVSVQSGKILLVYFLGAHSGLQRHSFALHRPHYDGHHARKPAGIRPPSGRQHEPPDFPQIYPAGCLCLRARLPRRPFAVQTA